MFEGHDVFRVQAVPILGGNTYVAFYVSDEHLVSHPGHRDEFKGKLLVCFRVRRGEDTYSLFLLSAYLLFKLVLYYPFVI